VNISEFSLRRPVTVSMVTCCILVLGYVSFSRLPIEQLPNISSSGIRASARYSSASPEEIERLITVPLEAALGSMNNVERISSSSRNGSASVRVDFKAGTDMDLANMEMRERVDQARSFMPPEVDRVQLRRWQSDQRPIVNANIAWRGDGDRLLHIVQKVVQPRLMRLNGVADAQIEDLEQKQLTIELDRERLQTHNISLGRLGWQLNDNNVNMSLGRVFDGSDRFLVRAISEFSRAEQIGNLPLEGGQFRFRDIGEVVYGFPEKKRFKRLNGVDAAEVEVYKSSTANVVDIGGAVEEEFKKIEEDFDGLLDVEIVRNRADDVLSEAGKLFDSALIGAVLAMAIIYVFLRNIRSTMVVALAIPTAALCVFIGMYTAREVFNISITLNMVSMMGLMLAVGMLVDPAVVVLESIFRKSEEDGTSAKDSALIGSREVGIAVLASSLTTICVFVPFFFLSDSRSAVWMRDAGIAICLAVTVSMIVSLSLIPLAAARLFHDKMQRYDGLWKIFVILAISMIAYWRIGDATWSDIYVWWVNWQELVIASISGMSWTTLTGIIVSTTVCILCWIYCRSNSGLRTAYGNLLNWTLDHRLFALLVAGALTGSGYFLYGQIEHRGQPWQPERRVDVSIKIDRSYSIEDIREHFDLIEKLLMENKEELDIDALMTNFSQRRASVKAYLVDADVGKLSTMEAGEKIMELMPPKVGFTYKMGRSRSWAGNNLGVEVQLRGRNEEVLAVLIEDVKLVLQGLPGVKDVDSSLEDGEEEIHVEIDRSQALSYGLSPREIASSISTALGTRRTSSFKSDDREIDVVMQLNTGDRATLEQLKNSRFRSDGGNSVQLAALADFEVRRGPKNLSRENRELNVTVFANTENRRQAQELIPTIKKMMQNIELPAGYSWDLGRAARWMQEDERDTNFSALLAVVLIYLIMASLFESLIHPFTIMLSIPFSLIGVAIGLYIFDAPFDNNGALGLLILFGIVVNNGIVLIDHINNLRADGMNRREAIVLGGQRRLRPILMTAFTTILNLMPLVLPMIYGTAEGFSKRWGPIGLVIISGLMSSTVLTLILAPTLYSLLDDVGIWCRCVFSRALDDRDIQYSRNVLAK